MGLLQLPAQNTTQRGTQTTEIYSPTVPEAGSQKSAGLDSPETSLFGYRWPPPRCVLRRLFCACTSLLPLPPLVKTPIRLNQEPTLMASFNLITSLEAPSPDTVTLGVKVSTYKFGRNTSQSITPPTPALDKLNQRSAQVGNH